MGKTQESDIQKLDPRLKHVDLHSSNSHSHVVTCFPEWMGLKLLVNICDYISLTLIANEIRNNWEFFLFDHPSDLYFPFTCVVLCFVSGYFSILTHGGASYPRYPQCFNQVKRMNVSCGCLSPANLQAVPWFSRFRDSQAGIPPTNRGYVPAM